MTVLTTPTREDCYVSPDKTQEEVAAEYRFTRIDFEPFPAWKHITGGLRIGWGCEGIGFGELVLYTTADGQMLAHNETMSRAFVVALLAELGRRVQLED